MARVSKPRPRKLKGGPDAKYRPCLGLDCGKSFWSTDAGTRRCPRCAAKARGANYSLRELEEPMTVRGEGKA
jgi:hypothetical protein